MAGAAERLFAKLDFWGGMTLSKCNWQGLKVEWGGGVGGQSAPGSGSSPSTNMPPMQCQLAGVRGGAGCGGSLYLVSSEPQAG